MALIIHKSKKINGVDFMEGHFYSFKYNAYENDPEPMTIFINAITGTHPNTGHQHRYIQAINVNYLPRSDRKQFVNLWKKNLQSGTKLNFTWEIVKKKYPYMQFAIRRYLLKPDYYIRNARKIDIDKIEKEVVKGWFKDFSSILKRKVASKIKGFFVGKRKGK